MTLNMLELKLATLIIIAFAGAAVWEYAYGFNDGERWRKPFVYLGILFAIAGTILLFFFVH